MTLPFTVQKFFAVFEQYNSAVWPTQMIMLLLAIVAVASSVCPTTIFTIGVLMFMAAPFPRMLFAAPLLWSLIGGQAAFLLEVPQDLGLLAAGLLGATFVICPRPGPRH